MATIHVSRSGTTLGTFEEEKVREGLRTGEFIGTDLGWTEGMAAWRPLSELDNFRAAPKPAAPAAAVVVTATPAAPSAGTGLPWENRATLGWPNALLETIQMVLLRPAEAFAVMKREGGFVDPVLYAIVLGTIGAFISVAFSFGLNAIGIGSSRNGFGALVGMGFGMVAILVMMPIIIGIGTFIMAGITHVCLMMVGGAKKKPFEATLRVMCYASGSANVFQAVPFCGGWIAGIYSVVLNCMGLARVHETDTWRAVAAVLLPLVVCCGGLAVLFFIMIASISSNWH